MTDNWLRKTPKKCNWWSIGVISGPLSRYLKKNEGDKTSEFKRHLSASQGDYPRRHMMIQSTQHNVSNMVGGVLWYGHVSFKKKGTVSLAFSDDVTAEVERLIHSKRQDSSSQCRWIMTL